MFQTARGLRFYSTMSNLESLQLLKLASHKSYDDSDDHLDLKQELDDTTNQDGSCENVKRVNKTKTLLCGYGLGVVVLIINTAGMAFAHALDKSVPHSELNGLRFSFQMANTVPFLVAYRKCELRVERNKIGYLVLCAVLLTSYSYGKYGSVYYLPLGDSISIMNSLLLILNTMISWVAERSMKWYDALSCLLCVGGVIMVIQPEQLFHNYHDIPLLQTNYTHQSTCGGVSELVTPGNISVHNTSLVTTQNISSTHHIYSMMNDKFAGYALCLSSMAAFVLYMQIVNRRLADVDLFVYNFWASLIGAATSFSIMAATETPDLPAPVLCKTWLLGHALTSSTSALIMYKLCQLLEPRVISLILANQIPASFALQYTVFSRLHPGNINVVGICGACVVFVGNVFGLLYHLMHTSSDSERTK